MPTRNGGILHAVYRCGHLTLERVMGRFEALEVRRLLAAATSVWTVEGTDAANVITIDFDPTDATQLRARIDGKVVSTRALAGLDVVSVLGGAGNDRITI